jgi:hypothetical protein
MARRNVDWMTSRSWQDGHALDLGAVRSPCRQEAKVLSFQSRKIPIYVLLAMALSILVASLAWLAFPVGTVGNGDGVLGRHSASERGGEASEDGPSIASIFFHLTDFEKWRQGEEVARADFDPGIAPFTVTVRKVPVPVTNSYHFIVALYRGQYVVTSFRYFWEGLTPHKVVIDWPCVERFTVTFDDSHVAACSWSWGKSASWTMTERTGDTPAGLSAYYFTPQNPLPAGCYPPP